MGGGLTAGFGQPDGVWAGYGTVSVAALVGCATLWQQRGLMERHAKEMARRRREDLEEAAVAEQRQQADLDRVRAELAHEQQYSGLIQDQLTRAREQLDKERAARRAAERELDALTGAASWPVGGSSLLLTVEEPVASGEAVTRAEAAKSEALKSETAKPDSPTAETVKADEARPVGWPAVAGSIAAQPPSLQPAGSAAQRRGWQFVEGDGEDEIDELDADADRIYRPFIDQLAIAAVSVSDAALAMAPVISAADLDDILDLTAYDETVEFSVREIKGTA